MNRSDLEAREKQILREFKRGTKPFLKELKRFLKEAEGTGDLYYIGRINLSIAICYFDLGNRNYILPYAVKAADVFEKLNDRNRLASSYNVVGLAYRAIGNYSRAIEYYDMTLVTIRGMRKPIARRDVMISNIAESCFLMGEYKDSARMLRSCVSVIRTKHPEDHVSAVIFAINLSDAYEGQGKLGQALETLEAAEKNVELLDRDVLRWGYYARKCCVLYKLGRREDAEHYADLTIDAVTNGYDSYEFHRDFEKIAQQEVQAGDFKRAQCFSDILTDYATNNKNTIDLIISKRVQLCICEARGQQERSVSLAKELNALYENRLNEQNYMQYESRKRAEGASREIASLMKKIRVSEEKAERDALTGLMNRAALVSVTNEFIQKAKSSGKKLGGVFLDIDYFKEFNDTYGHAAGDDAIRVVADACMAEESNTIKFFRYGGDEFFGLVLGHKDAELEALGHRIAERIRSSGIRHEKNPNCRRLTVSVGVANVNMKQASSTMLDIIKYSDNALYHAKDSGRDAIFAFQAVSESEQVFRRVTAQES